MIWNLIKATWNYFWCWLSHWCRDDKAAFRFWDGKAVRIVDAFEVLGMLDADPGCDLFADARLLEVNDRAAMHRLARATKWAFAIPPFEKGGLSEVDCLKLLDRFLRHCVSLSLYYCFFLQETTATAEHAESKKES